MYYDFQSACISLYVAVVIVVVVVQSKSNRRRALPRRRLLFDSCPHKISCCMHIAHISIGLYAHQFDMCWPRLIECVTLGFCVLAADIDADIVVCALGKLGNHSNKRFT